MPGDHDPKMQKIHRLIVVIDRSWESWPSCNCCIMGKMRHCVHGVSFDTLLRFGCNITLGSPATRNGILSSLRQPSFKRSYRRGGTLGVDGFTDSYWGNRIQHRSTTGKMGHRWPDSTGRLCSGDPRCRRWVSLSTAEAE